MPWSGERPKYFSEIGDIIFDTDRTIWIDIPHILKNKERLPAAVRDDDNIDKIIQNAFDVVRRKIELNYRVAVPQYFENEIQFLIPLGLVNNHVVDVALAVKSVGSSYEGKTCLALDWAYNNARLLAKLESDWLKP